MKRDESPGSGDAFLEERLARVDSWLREGKVSFSSKVIPVGESLATQQWVLPTEQVIEILRQARSFALAHCACRLHYQRCDNPTEVCFFLDDAADACVAAGEARYVALDQATEALRQANARGLVHLTVYDPGQYVFALCSCCACCCHDLQFLRVYGRHDLIAHSEYVSVTDVEACTHCGDCIERCVFGARVWDGAEMRFDRGACYGCGLCATVCPAEAIAMVARSGQPAEGRRPEEG